MIGKIPVNGSLDQDEPNDQRVANNVDGNQQGSVQQVGETFEETFMNEVRNIGERRARRPPNRFDDECYLANDITADIKEPINIDEAFSGEHSEDKNIVDNKWVFKVKRDENGDVQRYKVRLVAKGYSQTEGVNYNEVYSSVVRNTTIRSLLALSNAKNWEVHQMDVQTAFLQGNLEEEVYMRQPDGYVNEEYPDYVCKLKKILVRFMFVHEIHQRS